MSNFGDHPAGFFGVSGFYNGVATQSLRFDDGSTHYLSRTPSSAGNRRIWTWSSWIKRGVLDGANVGGSNDTPIFSACDTSGASSTSPFDVIRTISQLTATANILNLTISHNFDLTYHHQLLQILNHMLISYLLVAQLDDLFHCYLDFCNDN